MPVVSRSCCRQLRRRFGLRPGLKEVPTCLETRREQCHPDLGLGRRRLMRAAVPRVSGPLLDKRFHETDHMPSCHSGAPNGAKPAESSKRHGARTRTRPLPMLMRILCRVQRHASAWPAPALSRALPVGIRRVRSRSRGPRSMASSPLRAGYRCSTLAEQGRMHGQAATRRSSSSDSSAKSSSQ
jgi:hypothetical protein